MTEVVEAIPEAPHPQANTVKVTIVGYQNGSKVINTFFFKYIAGAVPTTTDLTNLCSAFWAHIEPEYMAWPTSRYAINHLEAVDLGHLPQIGVNYVPPAASGTGGSVSAPGNTSVGLRRTTGGRGKSYRGRIMLPPPDRGDIVDDILQGTKRIHLTNLASLLLDPYPFFGGNVWRPAVGSNRLVGSNAIISWVFDLVADSMKTRLLGHGD